MSAKQLTFCVDFDGTVVTHEYPEIGKPISRCIETLKKLIAAGHKIILFTMRSGKELDDAVNYLHENDVALYGVNENPDQTWSPSRKVYAHHYIDDAAIGTYLTGNTNICKRPWVDWGAVERHLIDLGYIND